MCSLASAGGKDTGICKNRVSLWNCRGVVWRHKGDENGSGHSNISSKCVQYDSELLLLFGTELD